ncbi:MAG: alanine dehydrogenase, partial [Gammaproteobacteria bacterium]|nr:alanine dehydrogenase [Gammaproteobacteria bacterium]
MRIGVPTELKPLEGRVGLIPAACASLVSEGHEVYVQSGAGNKSGYDDDQYRAIGVNIASSAASLFEKSEMIVKVKEPIDPDLEHLRSDHLLFCYLHLAALPELTRRLCDIGAVCVAFETVEDEQHRLPLLAPMSDIAGRLSIQVATHLL